MPLFHQVRALPWRGAVTLTYRIPLGEPAIVVTIGFVVVPIGSVDQPSSPYLCIVERPGRASASCAV